MKSVRLRETVLSAMPNVRVEGNVVHGVKFLGFTSSNGRRYLPEAALKAVALYDGKPVYIDHQFPQPGMPDRPRDFVAKFAVTMSPVWREDGVYGSIRFNPKHLLADTFVGWLETDPNAIGLSHVATGQVIEGADGIPEVVEITDVESVDLVSSPATTNGLFESDCMHDMMPLMTPPEKEGDEGGEVVGLDAAVSQLIASILNDENLDKKTKRDKVLSALDLLEDGEQPAPVGNGESASKEAPPVEDAGNDDSEDEDEEEDMKKVEAAINAGIERINALFEAKSKEIEARLEVKSPIALPVTPADGKPVTVDDLMEAITKGK